MKCSWHCYFPVEGEETGTRERNWLNFLFICLFLAYIADQLFSSINFIKQTLEREQEWQWNFPLSIVRALDLSLTWAEWRSLKNVSTLSLSPSYCLAAHLRYGQAPLSLWSGQLGVLTCNDKHETVTTLLATFVLLRMHFKKRWIF